MKNLSSKRAKALAISMRVKDKVWERDNRQCVYCGSRYALPEAHYIARSHGGLGIEQNILTLCRPCHDRYDKGLREEREKMRDFFSGYLKSKYPDWNEESLIYRR